MKVLGSGEIPSEDDHVRWVADEIEDFLRAGQVGLYEVVDSLRARYSVTSDSEYLPDAYRVLRLLLSLELGELRRVTWADHQVGTLLATRDLTDAWFDAPSEASGDEYVVLEPHRPTGSVPPPHLPSAPDQVPE